MQFNQLFDRKITATDGDQITIDAPLYFRIDASLGGGQIAHIGKAA